MLLGQKDIEIFALQKQIQQLQAELKKQEHKQYLELQNDEHTTRKHEFVLKKEEQEKRKVDEAVEEQEA